MDPGGLVGEQQNLPQIKTAVVINREFLDKLLLFQSKELQAPVQNVNVDLEESCMGWVNRRQTSCRPGTSL